MRPDYLHIPDNADPTAALARLTHLAVGTHPDDVEIMAYSGIAVCYADPAQWFGAAVMTSGGGSPRTGRYASLSDEQMAAQRRQEQLRAADLGRYGALMHYDYSSAELKAGHKACSDSLAELLLSCRPRVLYIHSPFDEHPTHLAACRSVLAALHSLPPECCPEQVLGCEVWGSLDWLSPDRRVELDCSAWPELAVGLLEAFESQIDGGKRYDLAALARRRANATFSASDQIDRLAQVTFAVDLTDVVRGRLALEDFVRECLTEFSARRLKALLGQ